MDRFELFKRSDSSNGCKLDILLTPCRQPLTGQPLCFSSGVQANSLPTLGVYFFARSRFQQFKHRALVELVPSQEKGFLHEKKHFLYPS